MRSVEAPNYELVCNVHLFRWLCCPWLTALTSPMLHNNLVNPSYQLLHNWPLPGITGHRVLFLQEGKYEQQSLPNAKFMVWLSRISRRDWHLVRNIPTERQMTRPEVMTLTLCAFGLQELNCYPVLVLVFWLFFFLQICLIDGSLTDNQIRSPEAQKSKYC